MDISINDFCYERVTDNNNDLFLSKIDIFPDLPIELQINPDDFNETLKNFYKYFLGSNVIGALPEPFFSDYVEEFTERVFYRTNFKNCINELKKIK